MRRIPADACFVVATAGGCERRARLVSLRRTPGGLKRELPRNWVIRCCGMVRLLQVDTWLTVVGERLRAGVIVDRVAFHGHCAQRRAAILGLRVLWQAETAVGPVVVVPWIVAVGIGILRGRAGRA
jgi:hypothetical protein